MIGKPLITLGLPVYNGEGCIEFTLRSISEALSGIRDIGLIEILVSDNMSVDNTCAVIEGFIRSGLNIVYNCNQANIGYDKNIDAIVRKAAGKYVWFVGCGEKLKVDSLSRLIEKLDNDMDYTNVVLDFDIYDEARDEITDLGIFAFHDDVLLEGKNNFEYGKYGPAVSSNVINRSKWQRIAGEPLVVDGWCHVERILSMIALDENSKTSLLATPYFTLFREKGGWWTKPNSYLLLLLHLDVIMSMLDKGFSKEVVEKLQRGHSRIVLMMAVMQSKGYGLKADRELIRDMIRRFGKDLFFWIFVFPILILPKQFDVFAKIMLKVLKTMRALK